MLQTNVTLKGMRICPFCNAEATSEHHIIPRDEGGTDDSRNLIYLCKSCHDEYEGQSFSPQMISQERLRKLGRKATDKEEYHYINAEGGLLFLGIRIPGIVRLVGGPIFMPFNAQFTYLPVTKVPENKPNDIQIQHAPEITELPVIKVYTKRKMGRPPVVISPDIVLGPGSLREIGRQAGVSQTTIKRLKDRLRRPSPASLPGRGSR